ncbi:MAG: alpha/beta fold hydrolase [Acidimicrobiales bacterium]
MRRVGVPRSACRRAAVVVLALGLAALPAACSTDPAAGAAPDPAAPPTSDVLAFHAPGSTVSGTPADPASPDDVSGNGSGDGAALDPGEAALVFDRPVDLMVPDDLAADDEAPVVIVLHGFTADRNVQRIYFGFDTPARERGVIMVYADGTADRDGSRFWNATDACCNLYGSDVDDVAYLSAVVDFVATVHPIDRRRVYLVGHSNGGFMSHRMACDRADLFAAIVSLAGAMHLDPDDCRPSEPVDVVEAHGTLDDVIRYDGGTLFMAPYPSAERTVADWAEFDHCTGGRVDTRTLDLDTRVRGAETQVSEYEGCPDGGDVELWTIEGAGHIPTIDAGFAETVLDWLLAHPDA